MLKLLIGGSPCTHWSIAQTKHRETEPSGIGWELFQNFLIAREKYRPDYFLYENNKSMAPAIRAQITRELGVEPILINSALLSAQSRQRLYWTNIPGVEQPEDRGLLLRDVLDGGDVFGADSREKAFALTANDYKGEPLRVGLFPNRAGEAKNNQSKRIYSPDGKFVALCTSNDEKVAVPVGETQAGKSLTIKAQYGKNNVTNFIHTGGTFGATGVAEPVRIGTIESGTDTEHDSRPFRVYSPDAKGITLIGNGGGGGAKTGLYAVPLEYNPLHSCDVVVTERNIRCAYKDGSGTVQGYTVQFDDVKASAVIAGQAHKMKVIEQVTGKEQPVYEVKDGLITIKDKTYPIKLVDGYYIIRKLTVLECMRLQTVPEWYAFPVSDTQAYKMLGNGWTVDVVAHILSYAPGIDAEPVEVLGMYDGMSCGHIALDKLGASVSCYYAMEIDKYAIQTTQHNYPDTVQLGDAFQVREDGWRPEGKKSI